MSRVPRIRFKGFEEDWEQRKLGEIVDVCSGRDYKHLLEGDIPVYGTGGYMISVNKALSYDRDAIGIGRKGTIDKPYILNAPFWTVDTLFYVIPRNKIALIFAFGIFQNIDWEKKDESTGVPSLSKSAINEIDVLIPKYEEQQVLGLFFNGLDHLITLHQRKLEKLKTIKKSMLENLFPQNGEKTPKIRFSGFTEDWEQHKLGEVIQERNIRTSDFDRFPIFSLTIESGITPKTERYERGSLVTKTEDLFKVVKPNEFVTNPMNLRFGALGYNTQEYDISVSGYYDVFSIDGNNCSGFWNAYFKTQHVMNIFDNLATGSLVEKKRVKYSTLKKIYLPMPSTIEEKNKVSKFMIFTGHLITLHQSKLEKLQKIKKSMLESMFV